MNNSETTHEMEGFVHPTGISGEIEEAKVDFIIRDHDTKQTPHHIERLENMQDAEVLWSRLQC